MRMWNTFFRGALWLLALGAPAALMGCSGGSAATTPEITREPASLTAAVGQSVTFSVTASGSDLTYQWYKDGALLAGATGASLTIPSASVGDTGAYYLIVSNPVGSDTSATVTLTVSATTGGSTVLVN